MLHRKVIFAVIAALSMLSFVGCSDARTASWNISKASDQFEVMRRIVFYNGVTDAYPLEIIGLCSINSEGGRHIAVTCKTGNDAYKKHYMGLSDNMTYIVEQLKPRDVNVHHYRVVFKPQAILPDWDIRFDADELPAVIPEVNRKAET